MSGFLDRVAFSVGTERYHWKDAVVAAVAWGRWTTLARDADEGVSLERAARLAGSLPSRAELDAEAVEFRYARNLTSAEATRLWLERHDLTLERWTAALRRALVRRRPPSDRLIAPATASDRDVLDDAICWGALEEVARELSVRAAAAAAAESDDEAAAAPDAPPGDDDARLVFPDLPDDSARPAGTLLDEGAFTAALARLARVERAYRRVRVRTATPERVRAQIGAHQLGWVRLDCQALAFTDEQAAREAALSLRDDGIPPAEVARSARVSLVERGFFLEEVAGPLRDRLLGAREGDVVGPLTGEQDGTTTLYVVRRKTLPSAEDPVVRARAESLVMHSLLGGELAGRVEWAP